MNDHYKIRISFIFLLFCAFYCIMIGNLFVIQIHNQEFYIKLARQQYNVSITAPFERANIFDRNMSQLTVNYERISAFIMPKLLKNPERLEPFLKKNWPQALERLYRHKHDMFMFVERNMCKADQELVAEKKISDIKFLKESGRYYPHKHMAPVIGFTTMDNQGAVGIELAYNAQLGGSPATYLLEKDARSGYFYFTKETQIEGSKGDNLCLTIDHTLQFLAYDELQKTIDHYKAREGAVLIMNPTNGHILAMVTAPTFDPNSTKTIDIQQTRNIPITDAYELGSVMKIITALAALEEGVVEPEELINCENSKHTTVCGRAVNTWQPHGIIPFNQVIQRSNNIGIAKIALRLGTILYNHFIRLDFGKKTGIELPGEHTGFVNPPDKWSKQSIISFSFGYETTATLLQLARAFSIFCNDGKMVTPTIIMRENHEPIYTEPLYSARSINLVRSIMEKTVKEGTGHRAYLENYTIMGKTGTANLIVDGHYDATKNIYTFIGIVEKGDYKRIIVTFVKQGLRPDLYASQVTAPLFATIAERMLLYDKVF
jgi:cell division protein FtsI (penicillin-binding protein 3)